MPYHAHCHVQQMCEHNRHRSHQTASVYDHPNKMQLFYRLVNIVHNWHDSCGPKMIARIVLFRCSTIWPPYHHLLWPIFCLLDEIPRYEHRTMPKMCKMFHELLAPKPVRAKIDQKKIGKLWVLVRGNIVISNRMTVNFIWMNFMAINYVWL